MWFLSPIFTEEMCLMDRHIKGRGWVRPPLHLHYLLQYCGVDRCWT